MELTGEMKQQITDSIHKLTSFGIPNDEQEQAKLAERVQSKLKSGKKLSRKEEAYLQQTNPIMYMHYQRIMAVKQSVESRLKNARSKQEVEAIRSSALSSVSKDDPTKEYMIAAINESVDCFKDSDTYKNLPETDAEVGKRSYSNRLKGNEDDSEDEEEGIRITYEFDSNGYQTSFASLAATVGFAAGS